MSGKKLLAGIFAALTLMKLAFLLISPASWLGVTQAFLGQSAAVLAIYLVLLVVTGYFIFTSFNLIDVAVVMLFTSLLVGLTLLPYSGAMLKVGQEIGTIGLGRAWLALIIWVAIAVAVLYRIFAGKKER
jgi:hypothetical protein